MSEAQSGKHWVGFDLGGTKMQASVFDADFKTLGRHRKKTKGHEGSDTGLSRMAQTIHSAIADAGLRIEDLGGIGVGCAGPLDLACGLIHDAPNLGWKDVPVKKSLEKEFGCPVVVVNDVDAGVYGEYCFGAAKGSRNVVGVFPGTGIGGGCVLDGKIVTGRNQSCMEIGHIPIVPDGPTCGCGQKGCLEAVASRLAISAAAAQAAFRGLAPNLMRAVGTDLTNIRSGALAAAIEAGDKTIEQIVRTAAEYIGLAVVTLVHLLNPDTIVLGGGLVEAMPDLILKTVERTAKKRALPSFVDTFQIIRAKLADDASVMGAAAWAQKSLLSS